jgi:signal transduction histidine kinase
VEGRQNGRTGQARVITAEGVDRDFRWLTLSGFAVWAVLTVLASTLPFSAHDPSLRATLETGFTVAAIASLFLFRSRFKHTGAITDLFVLVALMCLALAELALYAGPAMLGLHAAPFDATASLGTRLLVAVAFAVAGIARPGRTIGPRAAAMVLFVSGAITIAAIALALGLGGQNSLVASAHGQRVSLTPGFLLFTLPTLALMTIGISGLLRKALSERQPIQTLLALGGMCSVIAWMVVAPQPASGWVSGREVLRLLAYALILGAAVISYAQLRAVAEDRLAARERRRLAGDLHDGLAQDLAFIVAHGERLEAVRAERELVAATRRALAASRGAIVDLAASDQPNAAAALKAVGTELANRHAVRVAVRAEPVELSSREREELVRIAREAITNAVHHGRAREITVSLHQRGDQLVLRVDDDGCGIADGISSDARRGFGLQMMHERARTLGGHLAARRSAGGGTSVEVSID